MKQFYILFFYCTVYIVIATKFKHETQHHSISDLKEFFEKEIETMQLKQDQIVKNMKAEMSENNNLLEQKMINMKMKFDSENNDKTGKIKQLEEQLKKQEKRFVAEIIDLQQKLNKIGSGRRNIITKQACSIEVKNLSNTVTRFTKEVLKLKDDIDRVDNDVKVIEKTMKGVNKDKRTNYTDSEDSAEGNTAFVQSIRHQGRGIVNLFVQLNLNSSNTDGSFPMVNSNSYLSTYEIRPIAQENKKQKLQEVFILSLNCMLCILIRITLTRRF